MANLYYQSDKLQDLINWDVIMDLPRYSGGHDEQMKNLFKDSKLIGHWNEGGYQGMVATCVKLEDGRFVIYNDYYGSCSGCDGWEGASDPEVHYMCLQLSNSAYIFKSIHSVMHFLKNPTRENEWSSWSNPATGLLKILEARQPTIKHKI